MTTVAFKINNQEYLGEAGANLLAQATELGVDIPHLCYDSRLQPFGACRLCFVELVGRPKPVPACSLIVTEGMEIITESDQLHEIRKMALELIMAEHCGDCISPCQQACPAGIDIQGFIAQIENGNYDMAATIIRETMPLPSICGRVCPRFCEDSCRRTLVDDPVDICGLKRIAGDHWLEKLGDSTPLIKADTGKSVAVVGGGPAGLTAAYFLAINGHRVTLYDAGPRLGGMLRYGIPEYRLPNSLLDQEIKVITDLCDQVILGKKLGVDFTLDQLQQDFDAVFLGIGCHEAQLPGIENQDLLGIESGIGFLRDVCLGKQVKVGDRVAVVGGGNTAMDAARTAVRLGAREVMAFYRRTQAEMPAEPLEVKEAMEEGVKFYFLTNPVAFHGSEQVTEIELVKMELGAPDQSGRRRPVEVPGSEFKIAVDNVILALGQKVEQETLSKLDLALTRWNTIETGAQNGLSSKTGIYAAGDCVNGAATVVEAVGEARKVATQMDAYLRDINLDVKKPFVISRGSLDELDPKEFAAEHPAIDRARPHHLSAAERMKNFDEYCFGLNSEEAASEADRCLACGCLDANDCELRDLATEYGVEMTMFTDTKKRYRIDNSHPNIQRDPNKCILCGKCVAACKEIAGVNAYGFVDRGFDTTVQPALNLPLKDVCQSCGLCVTVCPTGALTPQYSWVERGPWVRDRVVATTCLQCSLGCGLEIDLVNDKIVGVASPVSDPVSNGLLCKLGSFNYEFLYDNRVVEPYIKNEANQLTNTDWDKALKSVADSLSVIKAKYGPESLAVLAAPNLTNEESELAVKLATEVLGTENIYSTQSNLGQLVPSEDPLDITRLMESDLIIVVNTDLQQDYLPLAHQMRVYCKQGGKLINVTAEELEQEIVEAYLEASQPLIIMGEDAVTGEDLAKLQDFVKRSGKHQVAQGIVVLHSGGNTRGQSLMGIAGIPTDLNQLKGLIVIGDDLAPVELASNAEFIVAITPSVTPELDLVDVVLPGSTFLETSGTTINFGGRKNQLDIVVEPQSGKNNQQILLELVKVFKLG